MIWRTRVSGEPGPVVGDDHVGQGLSEPVELPRPDGVLEAGERRLRGEVGIRAGVAAHEELVDRVGLEVGGVVRIGVAAGQAEAALPDQRGQILLDLPRLAPLGNARRQAGGEMQVVVDGLEEHRPAVGALLRGVESRDQRLLEQRGEQHRLGNSLFGHSWPSSVCGTPRPHREYHSSRLLGTLYS